MRNKNKIHFDFDGQSEYGQESTVVHGNETVVAKQ
jgi:hypothetical protein